VLRQGQLGQAAIDRPGQVFKGIQQRAVEIEKDRPVIDLAAPT
jgi:hypothetical protein